MITARSSGRKLGILAMFFGLALATPISGAQAQLSMSIQSGSPQTVTDTSKFGTLMEVNVVDHKDSSNNNVFKAGTQVQFAAPDFTNTLGVLPAIPSGTFSQDGTGSNPVFSCTISGNTITDGTCVTVTTDGNGNATAPTFVANAKASTSSYTVTATVVSNTSLTQNFVLTNKLGSASSIAPTSGNGQSVTFNQQAASPLVAQVTDVGGNPVPSASVTFTAPSSGATATLSSSGGGSFTSSPVTVSTDSNGNATVYATGNGTSGNYSITAKLSGSVAQAQFTLINSSGPAANMTMTLGSTTCPASSTNGPCPASGSISANINTSYGTPTVTVTDSSNNPVTGQVIFFEAPGGGASGTFAGGATTASVSTGSNGTAQAPAFTANGTAGQFNLIVSLQGFNSVQNGQATTTSVSRNFTLTNVATTPAAIAIYAGPPQSSPQTAALSTAFTNPLQAIVTDAGGNGVGGQTVTFNLTAGTGSGSFNSLSSGTTSVTATSCSTVGANCPAVGVATAPALYANGTAGNFTVRASTGSFSTASSGDFQLTNSAAGTVTPTAVSLTQNTPVSTAFPKPLQVVVLDTSKNPQVGTPVIFTSVNNTGNPGGTFATSGNPANTTVTNNGTVATAFTDSTGTATSPVLTSNATVGSFTVSAAAGSMASAQPFNLTITPGAPATVAKVSPAGATQSTQILTAFGGTSTPVPFVVKVTDSGSNPVPGATVIFSVPNTPGQPGGTFTNGGSTASVTTLSDGTATSPFLIANNVVSPSGSTYNLAVTVNGAPSSVTTSFALSNTPAGVASIAVSSGSGQSATIGQSFSPLVVLVKDGGGNPYQGATVTFSVPSSGPSAVLPSPATAVTNASGLATLTVTANNKTGVYNVTASTPNAAGTTISTQFTLTNNSGVVASVTPPPAAAGPFSTPVSTAFGTILQVTVADAGGNPINNTPVTFAIGSAGGASANFTSASGPTSVTVNTNAQGIAFAPTVIANATAGGPYTVTATSGTASTSFSLTNTQNRAAKIVIDSAQSQSTFVLTQFASTPTVTVVDSFNNPVSQAQVTFTVQPSASQAGGSFGGTSGVTKETITTGASGIAATDPFWANAIAGTYTVSVSVQGVPTTASFSMTNVNSAQLKVVVNAVGKDGTFNFSNQTLGNFSISTTGGTGSKTFKPVSNGNYPITIGTLPFGFKLASAACSPGSAASNNSMTATLSGANANSTCTVNIYFDTAGIRTTTQAAIKTFMQNRADTIVSSQPRATRGDGRFTGSLFGDPVADATTDNTTVVPRKQGFTDNSAQQAQTALNNPALTAGMTQSQQRQATVQNLIGDKSGTTTSTVSNPISLAGSSDASNGNSSTMVSAFVSLSALRTTQAEIEAAKAKDAGLAYNGNYGSGGYAGATKFDLWAEVQSNAYQSTLGSKQSGFSEIAYVGADYLVRPAILLGVLAQVDWTKQVSSEAAIGTGIGANGVGWMAGPYVAVKLTPNLTFDTRAAWGQSTNTVNPFGVYNDTFGTDRVLASGRLTGNWGYGQWRFTPEASIVYFEETQRAYTDQFGVFIPGQTVMLGRFSAGPEVGYQIKSTSGDVYEPHVGVKGVYDFSKQDAVGPDGSLSAPETFRGKVEAGLSYKSSSGVSVQGLASYDGLGAKGFEDIQGQVSLRVPLQ